MDGWLPLGPGPAVLPGRSKRSARVRARWKRAKLHFVRRHLRGKQNSVRHSVPPSRPARPYRGGPRGGPGWRRRPFPPASGRAAGAMDRFFGRAALRLLLRPRSAPVRAGSGEWTPSLWPAGAHGPALGTRLGRTPAPCRLVFAGTLRPPEQKAAQGFLATLRMRESGEVVHPPSLSLSESQTCQPQGSPQFSCWAAHSRCPSFCPLPALWWMESGPWSHFGPICPSCGIPRVSLGAL